MSDEAAIRQAIGSAQRIVVKLGSSSLTDQYGGVDKDRIAHFVDVLARCHNQGRQVVLISSGAIAAGMAPLGLAHRPHDLAHQQACAAVGQRQLIQHYGDCFSSHGIIVGQVLLTAEDLMRRSTYTNALRTLGTMIRMGVVPIINENDTVATHEIRFGDNDRLAALVAQLIGADALILLSDVDGLYSSHPDDPDSYQITCCDVEMMDKIDTHRSGSSVGTGGMTTKLHAAQISAHGGIPALIGAASDIDQAVDGCKGTVFTPSKRRLPRKLLWLAHASMTRGIVRVDRGAHQALCDRNASLLAAGIIDIEGDFLAGDPVEITDPHGERIGRGIINFSAGDLRTMMGKRSLDLIETRGEEYGREVIHRDFLVLGTDK